MEQAGKEISESASGQRMHIHVTCAIIEREGRVMAARRGRSMRMPLKWEFPGGKIEAGETAEECLHRELMEEMALRISVKRRLPLWTHEYPDFTVTLHPFVCEILSGEVVLNEHHTVDWVGPEALPDLDWVEADRAVIEAYLWSIRGNDTPDRH
jgi:8-oxo-dGTP diphosphatase